MQYELEEIKKIRRNLGLTQMQLAKQAGVSQSIIAKIESGKIDPTYSKVKKIFEAISYFEKKQETNAEQIMNAKVISVSPGEDIKEAIKKMKKYDISQMPVIDDHKSIGLISESILLNALMDGKGKKVSDIMEDAPPIVSKKSSIKVISNLLRHYPMVLVTEGGKMAGLITKADLLGKMYGS
ncbi:CBS domain-containing protein [Candidatus Woesearchaeota archaeon]|nr:CBS domain-containing protein [Candidatus Woesearchaeota archaeon]